MTYRLRVIFICVVTAVHLRDSLSSTGRGRVVSDSLYPYGACLDVSRLPGIRRWRWKPLLTNGGRCNSSRRHTTSLNVLYWFYLLPSTRPEHSTPPTYGMTNPTQSATPGKGISSSIP